MLVVGAGLVGLTAALCLAEQGVAVRVVEREQAHPTRAFPVILHAQSVRLLRSLGALGSVGWRAAPVEELQLFRDGSKLTSLKVRAHDDGLAGVLVFEQGALRQALSSCLAKHGIRVEWNTELTALQQTSAGVQVRMLERDHSHGILFPASPTRGEVKAVAAQYVLGTDGYDSTVRSLLGIELEPYGPLQAYAFFQAVLSGGLGHQALLELGEGAASSAFPLAGGRGRFTFQLAGALDRTLDDEHLRRFLASRLPGYGGGVTHCEASSVVEFRGALARRLGVGRVWLAGDAVHTAPPLASSSVNTGMDEVSELSSAIATALNELRVPDLSVSYEARRRRGFRRLLGQEPHVPPGLLPAWAEPLSAELARSLPASAGDLSDLLGQLIACADDHRSADQPA